MASQKRVGVVLSGCGFLDGAEIHEAVCTLLSLDRHGAKLVAAAPDVPQLHVVDHLKGAPSEGETRGVLAEAARIVRGQIAPLSTISARDLDALIFPGGYGAAKNLCTFAVEGRAMRVQPDVERIVREMRGAGKPMGFICIAPVIAGRLFEPVTIGSRRYPSIALVVLAALGAALLVVVATAEWVHFNDEHAYWLAATRLWDGQPLYDPDKKGGPAWFGTALSSFGICYNRDALARYGARIVVFIGGVILADYRGLTVKDMKALRTSLRDSGAEVTAGFNPTVAAFTEGNSSISGGPCQASPSNARRNSSRRRWISFIAVPPVFPNA